MTDAIETISAPARRIRTRLIMVSAAAVAFLVGCLVLIALTPAGGEPVELMAVQTYGYAGEPIAEAAERLEEIKVDVMPAALPVEPVAKPAPAPKKVAAIRTPKAANAFNGRPLKKARTMEMIVTGYSPDARSCGKSADGITASGYSVWTNGMKMVAADTRVLPMKSVISIPGYNGGKPVPVLDRGGAIKGNRLDLLFPTHEEAMKWGKKKLTITVWAYAD